MDLKTIKTANNMSTASGIKKVALGVSFFSHLLFFITFPHMPGLWQTPEFKTYKVELIRDVIDDIPVEKLEELEKENSLKKLLDAGKDSEETISLDTKDKRYISYTRLLQKRLSSYWGYPKKAKEQLMEGKSHVLFSLSRDGQLIAVSITGSSGHEILDREGVDTIIRSVPFPPFPDSITVRRLNINVSFEYRLTSQKK
ncbi:MAG: TonB family protein [Desulfobacteraceae bacterium]|jgi:TonB family protein